MIPNKIKILTGHLQTLLGILLCVCISCEEADNRTGVPYVSPFATWDIPVDEVFDAGVGKDGIPSIDKPNFSPAEEINTAFDEVLVLGIEHEGELKAYPVPILNWHEIVNDEIQGLEVAITYCPLTGTGIGWGRRIDGFLTSYGVSGFLYNTNLIPYDRRTGSNWSQQKLASINGPLRGRKPQTHTLIETTFKTWKKAFPNSQVLNASTGFDRRYSEYPYGDYLTNDDLLFFPVAPLDNRLPAKERVLGIILDSLTHKVYRFNEEAAGLEVIEDTLGSQAVLVIRSKKDNIHAAFFPQKGRRYMPVQDAFPKIMKDTDSNYYDLAGRIIEGPDMGEKLERPLSFLGFWFSWGAFYPGIEIY